MVVGGGLNPACTFVPTAALVNAEPQTAAATLPLGVWTVATTSWVLSTAAALVFVMTAIPAFPLNVTPQLKVGAMVRMGCGFGLGCSCASAECIGSPMTVAAAATKRAPKAILFMNFPWREVGGTLAGTARGPVDRL